MIEVVYVVRHAFRSNWAVNPTTGEYTASVLSPTGIPTDPPLAAHGVEQAKELAEALWKLNPPVDLVYSSPFYRCLQTLQPATERWFREGKAGGEVRVEGGLGEFFGHAPFTHPSPPSLSTLTPLFPSTLSQSYTSLIAPCPTGETISQLHDRVGSTLHAIISTLDADPNQPKALLICSHAATIIAAGRALTGRRPDDLDEDDFQCFTAGLSRFERNKGGEGQVLGQWECVLNSETGFLSGGAERGWKFNGEESFVSFAGPEPGPGLEVEAAGGVHEGGDAGLASLHKL